MRTSTILRNLAAATALFGLLTFPVLAQQSVCLAQLHESTPPVLVNSSLAQKTKRLCYSEFILLHSGVSRTPVWSADRLTADRIRAADKLDRPGSSAFHAEKRLPKNVRSELEDYKSSGFDRGHMSPNGDMSTEDAQQESFSLANMIPQHPCLNEVLWEGIESAVRTLTLAQGEVFVVTGPAFIGDDIESLDERVMVPTHVFKAIYVPALRQAGAYWAPNDGSQQFEPVSIDRLQELTGINVFPKLDPRVRQTTMTLPKPTPHHKCRLRQDG